MADKILQSDFVAQLKKHSPELANVPDDLIMKQVYAMDPSVKDQIDTPEDITARQEAKKQAYRSSFVNPDFWERHPTTANIAKMGTSMLPGLGGVAGVALTAPETLGMASIPAMAVGSAAGKGAQDLINQYAGLTPTTSPLQKGLGEGWEGAKTAAWGLGAESGLGAINAIRQGTILKSIANTAGHALEDFKSPLTKFVTPNAADMFIDWLKNVGSESDIGEFGSTLTREPTMNRTPSGEMSPVSNDELLRQMYGSKTGTSPVIPPTAEPANPWSATIKPSAAESAGLRNTGTSADVPTSSAEPGSNPWSVKITPRPKAPITGTSSEVPPPTSGSSNPWSVKIEPPTSQTSGLKSTGTGFDVPKPSGDVTPWSAKINVEPTSPGFKIVRDPTTGRFTKVPESATSIQYKGITDENGVLRKVPKSVEEYDPETPSESQVSSSTSQQPRQTGPLTISRNSTLKDIDAAIAEAQANKHPDLANMPYEDWLKVPIENKGFIWSTDANGGAGGWHNESTMKFVRDTARMVEERARGGAIDVPFTTE